MGYNYGMEYEWDRKKAAANIRKHGVSFAEAATGVASEILAARGIAAWGSMKAVRTAVCPAG
jgi:uncharacterized DUF497 family protein